MNKMSVCLAASLASLVVMVQTTEAGTVLSSKVQCYRITDGGAPGWTKTLKINPQKMLTEKYGVVVGVIGLEHAQNTSESYYNQLAGAASFVPKSSLLLTDTVQISLTGNSYGTDTGGSAGVKGVWTINYAFSPTTSSLNGTKTFEPSAGGSAIVSNIQATTTEISCKDF